jgi:septal ring factor EnvC (AmiA/AmiB activator)
MKEMEDYQDTDLPEAVPVQPSNLHLPVGLVALAFAVFLFSQISNLSQNSRGMKWQADNLARQITSLTESGKRFEELLKQRETAVQQSQQVQTRYTEMLTDLLKLSEEDSDARSVVEKYKIQRQQQDSAAQSGAAASQKTP